MFELKRTNLTVKRALDLLLVALGLLLCAPLMALIALAIKLDSPGRVIFSQPRLGKDGQPFNLQKFRKFPGSWGDDGPAVTVAGDARMTRLGKFLERSKLDELPQLWNILRGEMSFVGPRPESLHYANLFEGDLAKVHDYLPGIFGPNQVEFRNESEMYPPDQDPEQFYREVLFPRKAHVDIAYFSWASVFTDLAWIGRGLWSSIFGAINWRRMLGLHGPILALDTIAIEIAWAGANSIRFAGLPPRGNLDVYLTGTWLFPVLLIPLMLLAGCYRHPVRHFAVGDAVRLVVVNVVGWPLVYLVLLGFFHRSGSIVLGALGMLLVLPMMGLPRIWLRERWRQEARQGGSKCTVRVAVYGAGRRGGGLVSLIEQGFSNAEVVGFLDDNDADMRGRVILGRKVLGSERDLNTIHAVYRIDQIWTTFEPDIHKHRRLHRWCGEHGVKLIVLPTTEPFLPLCFPPAEPLDGSQDRKAAPPTTRRPVARKGSC